MMPSAVDTLIARLQSDCTAAECAVRDQVEAQLKEADCGFFDCEGRHPRIDGVAR